LNSRLGLCIWAIWKARVKVLLSVIPGIYGMGYNQLDQKTEVWTAHGPCALLDFSYRSLCFPRTKEELTRAGETSNFPLWSCLIYKAKNKIYFL